MADDAALPKLIKLDTANFTYGSATIKGKTFVAVDGDDKVYQSQSMKSADDAETRAIHNAREIYMEGFKDRHIHKIIKLYESKFPNKLPDMFLLNANQKTLNTIREENDFDLLIEEGIINLNKPITKRKLFNDTHYAGSVKQDEWPKVITTGLGDNFSPNTYSKNNMFLENEVENKDIVSLQSATGTPIHKSGKNNSCGRKSPSRIPRLVLSPKQQHYMQILKHTPDKVTISLNISSSKRKSPYKRDFIKENAANVYSKRRLDRQANKKTSFKNKNNSAVKIHNANSVGSQVDHLKSLSTIPETGWVGKNYKTITKTPVQQESALTSTYSTELQSLRSKYSLTCINHIIKSPKESNNLQVTIASESMMKTLITDDACDTFGNTCRNLLFTEYENNGSLVNFSSTPLSDMSLDSLMNNTSQPNRTVNTEISGHRIFCMVILNAWRQRRLEVQGLIDRINRSEMQHVITKNRLDAAIKLYSIQEERHRALQLRIKTFLDEHNKSFMEVCKELVKAKSECKDLENQLQAMNLEYKNLNDILTQTVWKLMNSVKESQESNMALVAEKHMNETMKSYEKKYKLEVKNKIEVLTWHNKNLLEQLLLKDKQIEDIKLDHFTLFDSLKEKKVQNKRKVETLGILQAKFDDLNQIYDALKNQNKKSTIQIVLSRIRKMPVCNVLFTEIFRWIIGSEVLVLQNNSHYS